MSAPVRLAQPQNALHVYRHLLREASYLPPVCRARIEPRIRYRFRKHQGDPAPDKRLRQARHDFRNLRAANLGDVDRMRRAMMLTFGRIGWRRHELFADLRQPEQPDSSEQLEDRLHETRPVEDWLDRWDTEKLLAFAKSQANHTLRSSPRPKISSKRLDPAQAVPPISIWGAPFAEKTARSKERKWWKKSANRILPPLPRGEWELLKQLATGQAGAEWIVPARRAPADPTASDTMPISMPDDADKWDWKKYIKEPIRVVERPNSRRFRLSSGAGPPPPDSPYDGPAIGVHRYTPRFWRRLYGKLWQMTAAMERKPGGAGSNWDITWGGVRLRPLSPTATSHEFFEGVDSKGALLGGPGEKPPKNTQKTSRKKREKDAEQ